MEFKVFVETNVLLAASIIFTANDLGISFRHRFYDISRPLIGYLGNRISESIGLISMTVEQEAKGTLPKAILDTIKETIGFSKITDPEVIKKNYNIHTILLNYCSDNLIRYIANLQRDAIPEKELRGIFVQVEKMYLETKYGLEDKDIEKIAEEQAKQAPPRFYRLMKSVYKDQVFKEFIPIRRLKKHGPGFNDKRILSEAIFLKRKYNCELFFFASMDNAFSPIRSFKEDKIISIKLTNIINETFGVKCNWPDYILKEILKLN